MRNYLIYLGLLGMLGLAACGVKPDQLKAPEGSEDRVFPRTYPAPEEN